MEFFRAGRMYERALWKDEVAHPFINRAFLQDEVAHLGGTILGGCISFSLGIAATNHHFRAWLKQGPGRCRASSKSRF